ncbi:hypothetical protein IKG06_01175 [Candidatus Saccharibacteria bacterium]|nr:hypothetical protein [Candidatus Saccharibacteria bacterium]
MGLFENLFGTNPQYTVKDNKTGKETQVRDAKDLEKLAASEQGKNPDKPVDLFQRIFSR